MLKIEREDVGRLVMTGERHVVRLLESEDADKPYAYYHPIDHVMVDVMENGHHVEKYRTSYDVCGFVAEDVHWREDGSRPEDGVQKSVVRPKDLRDEFAMAALINMSGLVTPNSSIEYFVKRAYEIADVMMGVREENAKFSTIPMERWGVHITHCCKEHGCKYGDTDCPVELGQVKQEYPCQECDWND